MKSYGLNKLPKKIINTMHYGNESKNKNCSINDEKQFFAKLNPSKSIKCMGKHEKTVLIVLNYKFNNTNNKKNKNNVYEK